MYLKHIYTTILLSMNIFGAKKKKLVERNVFWSSLFTIHTFIYLLQSARRSTQALYCSTKHVSECCYMIELSHYSLFHLLLYVINYNLGEWLSWLGMLPLISSCGVQFPQFFEKHLLGSTPTLLTITGGLAGCARKSGLPLEAVRHLPRWSEFPLIFWLRRSPFAKDGRGLTCTNKTREANGLLVGRLCYEIPHVTPAWS